MSLAVESNRLRKKEHFILIHLTNEQNAFTEKLL